MAPTNRLIEARRAQLRAEAETDKEREEKTATASAKRQGGRATTRAKPKA